MLKIFRKYMLPLPFQYYLGMVGDRKVPQALGIEKQFGKNELLVTFDEEGSVWVDDEDMIKISQVSSTFVVKEKDFTNKVMIRHKEALRALSGVCKDVAELDKGEAAKCFRILANWHDAVIQFMPFLMVTKFLPDVVLRVIESKEAEFINSYPKLWDSIISPSKSKSLEFMESMLQLHKFCLEQDIDFNNIENLTIPAIKAVKDFKEEWGGFGPREWELPGYESTTYLLNCLNKFFGEFSLNDVKIIIEEQRKRAAQTEVAFSQGLAKLKVMS